MEFKAMILSVLLLTVQAEESSIVNVREPSTTTSYPVGDIRNCPATSTQIRDQPLYGMEVLPGTGFDNLRNLDMGLVHAHNYSQCKVSPDGKYLLPDNVFLIPLQQSKLDIFAEFFDHWDSYTDMTSSSINIGASYEAISAKFSVGYSSMKTHQVNDKSKSTRVQIRHKLYTVKIQPGAQLHPTFESSLLEIAANLQNNNTEYAHYLAELLIRDYGTHYTTSMDAGAILAKTDHISSSYVDNQSSQKSSITASASANFFGALSISSSISHSTTQQQKQGYADSTTHSEITTYGGPPFQPANFTLADWERGVPNALVAIDRSGESLDVAINTNTLPHLPEITVQQVSDVVNSAVNRYYKANTRHGCTDLSSPSFNIQANVDDKTCKPPNTNISFGGVYQTCKVDPSYDTENLCSSGPKPAQQTNPLTDDFSCPENYTRILLNSGVVTHSVMKQSCKQVCNKRCGLLGWGRCCHQQCGKAPFHSRAHYEAYWCAALAGSNIPQNSGYQFGGFYTSTTSNPLIGTRTCPRYFQPLHMLEDVEVCVSDDYELGYANAVTFGGFESCITGNPLANPKIKDPAKWPHTCPHGQTQHLVTVDEGCEINFCILSGAYTSSSLLHVKLPPFRKRPNNKANRTETLAVIGLSGEMWLKNESGKWHKMDSDSNDGQALLMQFSINPNDDTAASLSGNMGNGLSNGAVASLSIISTLLLGALVVAIIFLGRCVHRRRKKKQGMQPHTEYTELQNITSQEEA